MPIADTALVPAIDSPPESTSSGGHSLAYVEGMELVCQWVNGRYIVAEDWASLHG